MQKVIVVVEYNEWELSIISSLELHTTRDFNEANTVKFELLGWLDLTNRSIFR